VFKRARKKLSEIGHGPPAAALLGVSYAAFIMRLLFAEKAGALPGNRIALAIFFSIPLLYGAVVGFSGKGRGPWLVHLAVAAVVAVWGIVEEGAQAALIILALVLAAPAPFIGLGGLLGRFSSWPVNQRLTVSIAFAVALGVLAAVADRRGLIEMMPSYGCPPGGAIPE
jgi:hypothetical protein